jgi:hypothetical protein
VLEIADRPEGDVPAYLPGEHPFKDEFGKRHGLPEIATNGGAATMYPEFQVTAKDAMAKAAQEAEAARQAREKQQQQRRPPQAGR